MKKKSLAKFSVLIFTLVMIILLFTNCGSKKIGSSNMGTANLSNPQSNTENSFSTADTSYNLALNQSVHAAAKGAAVKSPAGYAASAKAAAESKLNSSTASKSNVLARKVILSGAMTIETNKFDAAVNGIVVKTQGAGGFVQSSNITGIKSENGNYLENREANFIIRIPSSKFETFMLSIGNLGVITSKTTTGEDITAQYIDNEARLKNQKIKEARLLDILKKAKNLSDILAIETELENTRYNIESLTGTLKLWDDQVDFSTLNITLSEIYEKKVLVKKPVTLIDKIKSSFTSSINLLVDILKGSLIVLVAIAPFAIIITIILLVVWIYIRRKK